MTSTRYFHPYPHSCSMEFARGCMPWDDVIAAAKGQWICVLGFLYFNNFFTVFNKNPTYWQFNKMVVGGPYKQNFLIVFNSNRRQSDTEHLLNKVAQWLRCSVPSQTTWDQSLGPMWWQERTFSYKLSRSLHAFNRACMHTCVCIHSYLYFMHTINKL